MSEGSSTHIQPSPAKKNDGRTNNSKAPAKMNVDHVEGRTRPHSRATHLTCSHSGSSSRDASFNRILLSFISTPTLEVYS